MRAIFGPAGNAADFPYKSSIDAPRWLSEAELDCYEYQCGKGVHIGEDTALRLGEAACQYGIRLSLHAPYFINLANPDPESLHKNVGYILDSCRAARRMGATRIVVHTGTLMKRTRQEALEIAAASVKHVMRVWEEEEFQDITLCLETMGKINQLGDLSEVLALCQLDSRILPCVDFGHLYARSLGALTGEAASKSILDQIEASLGTERASNFHAHFSRIEYTQNGGEKCHRTFSDNGGFGPEPEPLMREIARRGWCPTIICESAGTQAADALAMKKMYLEGLK